MSTYDKNAIGVLIGLGGASLCAVLALAFSQLRLHGPALREWLLWLVTPQFAIGMGVMLAIGLLALVLLVREVKP